jgi:hypothetical protein
MKPLNCPFCDKPAEKVGNVSWTNFYRCSDNKCAGHTVIAKLEEWNKRPCS